MPFSRALKPSPFFYYYAEEPTIEIKFWQETSRVVIFDRTIEVVQKTTVENPISIDGKKYDCTIYGDGTVQHFGIEFPKFLPATIYMECELESDLKESSK